MLRRTSTDSADTHCGYQEAAAGHLLEGQGSTHSTARAVLRPTCNDPMSGVVAAGPAQQGGGPQPPNMTAALAAAPYSDTSQSIVNAKVAALLQNMAPVPPLPPVGKYVKIQDLARGASGFVQLAQDTETGEMVAIKFMERGTHSKEVLLRELVNLSECGQHPNIVQLREVFLTQHHLGIAMEFVEGGDLAQYVQEHRIPGAGVPEAGARWLFQQILVAVDFCHRLGIALRDIKLDNVLIDHRGGGLPIVKLCDFGYSKAENFGSGCKTACGTPEYMAPEVLTSAKYKGNTADVWSLGVMLYVLIEGAFPFRLRRQRYQVQKMIGRIVNAEYKIPVQGSPLVVDLITRMLTADPAKRCTVSEMLQHPWVLSDLPPGTAELNKQLLQQASLRGGRLPHPEIMQVVEACQPPAPRPQVVPQQQQQQQQAQQQQQSPFGMVPHLQQQAHPGAAGQQQQQQYHHPGHGGAGPSTEQFMQPTPRGRGQQRSFPAMMSA